MDLTSHWTQDNGDSMLKAKLSSHVIWKPTGCFILKLEIARMRIFSVQGLSQPSGCRRFGLWSCGFRGNVIVYRAHKAIQVEECLPRRRSWSRFPLTRSCPELFLGTGPLLSLVLRTEDVWQRYNHCIEECWALNQGFPFSPLQWRPMIVPRGD